MLKKVNPQIFIVLVASKISSLLPNIQILINEVPKAWVDFEIYCQLVPNSDPNQANYKILPRIGAFEVSFQGVVSANRIGIFVTV